MVLDFPTVALCTVCVCVHGDRDVVLINTHLCESNRLSESLCEQLKLNEFFSQLQLNTSPVSRGGGRVIQASPVTQSACPLQ